MNLKKLLLLSSITLLVGFFNFVNINAQLKIDATGKVGVACEPSVHFQVHTRDTYNSSRTSTGASLEIGNYNSSWNKGFVQARNNTIQSFGLMFRIQSAGQLMVSFDIDPNGNVTFYKDYGPYSDIRLKTNIKNLEKEKSATLLTLTPIEFNYKLDTLPVDEKKHIGLSAQEVRELFPEAVFTGTDGYLRINYDNLVPIIIENLKMQYEKIKEQEAEVKKLKDKLESDSEYDESKLKGTNDYYEANTMDEAILYQNIPNPFSEATTIACYVPEGTTKALITIYDLQGKQVAVRDLNGTGELEVEIYGNELYPGMFKYSLIVNNTLVDTKTMVLTQ